MTNEELKDLIGKVRLAYPQASREYTIVQMVELYKEHLLNEDYIKVLRNLNSHINKSKYPPSIADLVADDKHWGTPVVIEKVPEKTPEEIARIKEIIAEGKKMLSEMLGGDKG